MNKNCIQKKIYVYAIANASVCGSRLNCVCKFDNFIFNTLMPIKTIFSGRNDPLDSTLKKNLFGFASQL